MKKIVVCVVTYNQEEFIGRAIESVLLQKDWGLYRIVVSDDCSKDRTWEILKEYQDQYPGLIEIHRNEPNLGMYQNFEKVETYLTEYDFLYILAGDDELCDGFFEAIQKLVEEENIDTNEAIGIFSDWKRVGPNGDEMIYHQDVILSGYSVWELKMRNLVSLRSSVVTKKVRERAEHTILDQGLRVAESVYDAQSFLHMDKVFYIPKVSSIYYAGIGESTHLSLKDSDYHTTQSIAKWNYFLSHYISSERDVHYAKYELIKAEYYLNPTWIKLFHIIVHFKNGQLPFLNSSSALVWRLMWRLIKYKIELKNNNSGSDNNSHS